MKRLFDFIRDEYKFIIFLIFLLVISLYPLNYYIVLGGGIKDIGNRVEVDNAFKEKGSFNISYVSEMQATPVTYGLSYIIPSWDREKISDYKYNDEETINDLDKRDKLELDSASSNAIYYAYTLANKEIVELSSKFIVLGTFDEYPNDFKVGDELISINSIKFDNTLKYKDVINNSNVNDILNVKIKRNKKEMIIKSKVYENNDNKILGIYLNNIKDFDTNPKVDISFASNEAGPSGGLITALSIYNKLVKEDITNGLIIAGTGTMEADGSIGTIGGIEYKLKGASKKADVFLVPMGENYEDAINLKKEKKYKIKIIGVTSLEDAINKLKDLK